MKITGIQHLHADGGYRNCHYVKVTTDSGLTGWSEYYDEFSAVRIDGLIDQFGAKAIAAGLDPTHPGPLSSILTATTRLAANGLATQAIAAIENACLDIAGKAAGVPVYQLLGGAFRTRIPVYWTHCGSLRVRHRQFYEEVLGTPPIRRLEDLRTVAEEAVAKGYSVIKTNPVRFDRGGPEFFSGGFRIMPGMIERNPEPALIGAMQDQMAAMRDGLGPDRGLMLDISFSHRTEGYLRIARALAEFDLFWLELDTPDADALKLVRDAAPMPIASLESLYGLGGYRPFIENRSSDVAIIDAMWNGVWQASRIATLADAHDINIAPHNPVGDLGNLMSAHLSAAVPNFRIMEYREDEAPWTHDFLTRRTVVENGEFLVPDAPGWGADIDESALAEHPPRS